jgi:hypothetical protein
MKRSLTMLLVLVCGACLAAGVPAPSTPRPMVNSSGDLLDSAHPMPVTVTAAPAMDTGSTSIVTPTSTPAQVTMLSGAKYIAFDATGTFECYIGSTTVTASTTPIYNIAFPTGDAAVIMLGQSGTATKVTIRQVGE